VNSLQIMRLGLLTVALTTVSLCHAQTQQDSDYERSFHSAVPLGAERIDLSSGKTMYILATAESPKFEGLRARDTGAQKMLLRADGSSFRFYPQHLEFRLTATAMRPDLLAIDSYGRLNLSAGEINSYLLALGFRLLIFHALQVTPVEPETMHLIGMPADVDYDERVYQIAFDLPHAVSSDDRIVLEVLSPGGSRLCKFHLDFF
jgi:hypothetical protein